MAMMQGFRRPVLRPDATWRRTADGAEFVYLDGERFVEFEFDADRRDAFYDFIELLADPRRTGEELPAAFPGTGDELGQMLEALDEQGMIAEGWAAPAGGVSGVGAYSALRRIADEVREHVRSPLFEALREGTATRDHLIGYAIEYWHVTHLCPRAIAPILARDDFEVGTWRKLMDFYMMERNHDRMLEKSLKAVGITREQLLRTQPLPATMAMMAALGVYAYDFPLALIATLFPMEEPEPDFLELFVARCNELGLPAEFLKPIMDHSDVNEDEGHDAVTLDILADFPYVSAEELQECGKAVADIIEQRARLDWEIYAWYAGGGVRDFGEKEYPTQAGRALVCAPLTSLV
jgi:heme oxygenase-like protein